MLETVGFQLIASNDGGFSYLCCCFCHRHCGCCEGGNADVMPLLSRRFINARRRIVQPMIDQSNRAGQSSPPLAVSQPKAL